MMPISSDESADVLDLNEDDFMNTLSAIHELIKKSNEQQRRIDDKLEYLSREIDASFKQTMSLKQEVDKLEFKIKCEREMGDISMKTLQKQVDELDKRWDGIVEKTKGLESDGLLGDLCHIAIYIEHAICAYTVPEVFKKDGDRGNLRSLLNLLNGNDQLTPLPGARDPSSEKAHCEKGLQEARERWAVVCKNFDFPDEWKIKMGVWEVSDHSVPGDMQAIEVLKSRLKGVCIIEKPINLKYAKQNVELVKYEMPLWQFDLVAGFIGSLREKMTKTGLLHGNLLLD